MDFSGGASKGTNFGTDYGRSKTTGECGIFKLLGYHDDTWCKMDTWN